MKSRFNAQEEIELQMKTTQISNRAALSNVTNSSVNSKLYYTNRTSTTYGN
jgi:hypothetical protein